MEHTLNILLAATLVAWVLVYIYRTQVAINWMIKLVAFTFLILTFQIFIDKFQLYRILLDAALILCLTWGLIFMVKTSGDRRFLKSKKDLKTKVS